MVSCQNCGKKLAKPERKIENKAFGIALYCCDRCGLKFKVTY